MSHAYLYFQPQNITALWLVLISHPIEGRRLAWVIGYIRRWFAHKMVTHPSTNQAQRTVTSLMAQRCYHYTNLPPVLIICNGGSVKQND